MAHEIIVDGVALIKIALATSATAYSALETLGYTQAGVEVDERPFMYDVHTDENGGDVGPPSDVQVMGEVHMIRMLFTKYDDAVLNKIRAIVAGNAPGQPPTPGTLMFQDTKFFRLLIHSTLRPRNYLRVFFREPKTLNKGTKHSQALVVAECHKDPTTGLLYNTTIT